MHSLFVEHGYADSVWCKELLHSLTAELRKRREDHVILRDTDTPGAEDTVFVIGSVFSWLQSTVRRCNDAGVVPILLCTSPQHIPGGRYHCVCSDLVGSMQLLTASVLQSRGARVALYGINPESVGDRAKAEAFLREHPHPEAVFENSTSLAHCYGRFAPLADQFDTVLCANGFAAVSLVQRLRADSPDTLNRLQVISCAQALLTRHCRGQITSVDMNFAVFGRTALGIADMVRKQPHIWELTASVKWSVEDAALQSPALSFVPEEPARDAFYRDEELQRMLKLENMLVACDDTDMTILTMLLQDKSYAAMAENCYLTEGAVKYRIKNMRSLCDVPGKEALMELLRQYLE